MIKTYYLSKSGENYQLSPHFKLYEFASPDSDKVLVDTRVLAMLEKVRAKFGGPINITSGYRTPTHNAFVGGIHNSAHLYGMAADFIVHNAKNEIVSSRDVCCFLQDIWFKGTIGYIGNATHIDVRDRYLIDETVKPYYYLNIERPGKNFRQYFGKPLYKVRITKGSNVRTGCGVTYPKKAYAEKGDTYPIWHVGKSITGSLWAKIGTYRWVYKGNTARV